MKKCKKKIFRGISLILALVIMASCVNADKVEAKTKSKKNVVILYFSATGTTKAVAKKIKKSTKGKIIEIKAKNPYTDDDLDYSDSDSRVTIEHNSARTPARSKVRPVISNLKDFKKAVKKADVVYIGYPIWWGEAPHILYSLVEEVNLKGKTVVPFCSSVSSGIGNSAKHLKAKAKISSSTSSG